MPTRTPSASPGSATRGQAALFQLEGLLRHLHSLATNRPDEFREAYQGMANEAARLAAVADFSAFFGGGLSPAATPLHYAAGCGCLEACSALLESCPRLSSVEDAAGQTPLFWAAQGGFCNTVRLLLRHGASAAHADAEDRTPLHLAASAGLVATCDALLASRACPLDARDASGLAPLHVAALGGYAQVCSLLLEAGASAAAAAPDGRTALHLAAATGHQAVLMSLLSAAPELLAMRDADGARPLDCARAQGAAESAGLLQSAAEAQGLEEQWRGLFEPECRASLNIARCEAFLEIGRPHLLGVGATDFHLACRLVDDVHLIESFQVEIRNSDASEQGADAQFGDRPRSRVLLPARVVRGRRQSSAGRRCGDVELAAPLGRPEVPTRRHLEAAWLRVVARLDLGRAAVQGVVAREVRSTWVGPALLRGRLGYEKVDDPRAFDWRP